MVNSSTPVLKDLLQRQGNLLPLAQQIEDHVDDISASIKRIDKKLNGVSNRLENLDKEVDHFYRSREHEQVTADILMIRDLLTELEQSLHSIEMPQCEQNSSQAKNAVLDTVFRELHIAGFPSLGPVFMFPSFISNIQQTWSVFPWMDRSQAEFPSELDAIQKELDYALTVALVPHPPSSLVSVMNSAGQFLEDLRKTLSVGKRYIKLLLYLATGWFESTDTGTKLSSVIETAIEHIHTLRRMRNKDRLRIHFTDRTSRPETEYPAPEPLLTTGFELLLMELQHFSRQWADIEIQLQKHRTVTETSHDLMVRCKSVSEDLSRTLPDRMAGKWYRILAKYCARFCFGSELSVSISDQSKQVVYNMTVSPDHVPGYG